MFRAEIIKKAHFFMKHCYKESGKGLCFILRSVSMPLADTDHCPKVTTEQRAKSTLRKCCTSPLQSTKSLVVMTSCLTL